MQGNSPFKMDQNRLNRVVCAVVFCLFTYMYLYFYQAEVVAAAQHVLAEGKTRYNPLIGAIIVTILLFALQTVILRLTKLHGRAHALTYSPSLVVLTFISSIGSRADQHFSFGAWVWVLPLFVVLFFLLLWAAKEVESYEPMNTGIGLFNRVMWISLMLLSLQFLLVGLFSNHDEVFHYRMKMERLIAKGNYKEALNVGRKSLASDSSLTMLRVHALAASGQLPEKLFDYPVVGGSEALRTNGTSVRTVILPDSIILEMADSSRYAHDFKLMGMLLDKNLAAFAQEVEYYYPDSVAMPKLYEEAILQYRYSNGKPLYDDEEGSQDHALEADFQGFNEMRNTLSDNRLRYNNLKKVYGNTYWFYYRYNK